MSPSKSLLFIFASLVLASCAPSGRYSQKHDSAPTRPPTSVELQDAEINHEPINGSTRPYTILGQEYYPMKTRQPYTKVGIASWYGKKFHGHLTSNGEVYDMYGMTAAHKTLPLPSYVKVTNLSNNRSVVVRVNDRGPFHQDRVIDLSYSAAYKIGVFDTGTAKVKIETILPETEFQLAKSFTEAQYHVRISGFSSRQEAIESKKGLALMLDTQAQSHADASATDIVFGPFESEEEAIDLVDKVKSFGFDSVQVEASH